MGTPVPVRGFRIVAAAGERAQIGAEEINERIRSLGGEPLPVVPLEASLPAGKLIVIAPCTAKGLVLPPSAGKVTPTDPGVQGYIIEPTGSGANLRLFLVGSDTLGTLYAAVTTRQLIDRRGGELVLQPARVRDWPDYKYRCNGTPFAEPLRGDWYAILSAEANTWERIPSSETRIISPGCTSLTYLAPTWRRAQVSEAKTWHPSSSPMLSGR